MAAVAILRMSRMATRHLTASIPCPFCEARIRPRPKCLARTQPWLFARHKSQVQKRRLARLELSSAVATPKPVKAASRRPQRKKVDGPFRGMNVTEPPLRKVKPGASPTEREMLGRKGDRGRRGTAGRYKALKMQRALNPVSYRQRAAVKETITDLDSFERLPLLPIVRESIATQALKGYQDIRPTPVQRLALRELLKANERQSQKRTDSPRRDGMQQFLLAAETGSGKTLAYLLPVIDALKRQELAEASRGKGEDAVVENQEEQNAMFKLDTPPLSKVQNPNSGRPRAIILVPTAELASQIGAVAKSLSHTVKFKASVISAAVSGTVIRNRLFSPMGVDVLISTPHLLASIAESEPNILSKVTHLVIDEADSLLDRSFSPLTSAIIDRSTPSLRQLILCSATIPRSLDSYLRKRFPDINRLVTPKLHTIQRRVQLAVRDVEKEPYQGNKDLACADAIWSIGKSDGGMEDATSEQRKRQVLVFVNEREKTSELSHYLVSKGIDAVPFNRDSPERSQAEVLAALTSSGRGLPQAPPSGLQKRADEFMPTALSGPIDLPNVEVTVATDLGSRGLDTLAVRFVILYDVPHTTVDFIHRLGRLGRMGRRGKGVVLVGKDDRRDVVKEVKEGMFRGQALI